MEYCYVEFEAHHEEKLNRLKAFLEVIKEDRSKDSDVTDAKWVKLFREEELDHFWWPNKGQYEQLKNQFGDLYVRIIDADDNEQEDWDIYSMFDAIKNSEYELIGVRQLSGNVYRLEIDPSGYPYGGIESLMKLITCMGHHVVAADDGTGRILLDGYEATN
ncbi:hypothetical protein ACX93W_26125 [Paenibacillus sp. CAU 1782]